MDDRILVIGRKLKKCDFLVKIIKSLEERQIPSSGEPCLEGNKINFGRSLHLVEVKKGGGDVVLL